MEFEIMEIEKKLDAVAWDKWMKFCESISRLFKLAGVPHEVGITIEDIEKVGKDIIEATALIEGEINGISFPITTPLDFGRPAPVRTAFVSYVEIGEVRIGYSAIMDLIPKVAADHILWRSVRIEPGRACALSRDPMEFSKFLQSVKMAAKTDIHLVRIPEATP